ncbi:MAG: Z1 domain-containing protein [Spiroplasma sp.]
MSLGLFKFLDDEEMVNINTSKKYLDSFKEVYLKKIDSDDLEQVISNAISIFSKCINKKKVLVNKTGLLLGKVQSGKTSNFLGLVALGFDNNIDVVILIGGKDSKLLAQNNKRLIEVFSLKDGSKEIIIENINDAIKISKNFFTLLNSKSNKKLIITCLKNVVHLEKLAIFLSNSELRVKNVMIIDDEGDQATLNSNAERKNKNATVLYQKITNILDFLSHFVYLQVTATAYANLFLRDSDILKPKFIQLIYPGKFYLGLNEFHGENSSEFIRIIDKNEIKNDDWDNNLINLLSFRKAFSSFLIASSLKMLKDKSKEISNSDMLIHTKRPINDHFIAANSLKNFITKLKKISNLEITDLRFSKYLEFCNSGFREFFNRNLDYFNNENDKYIIDNLKIILEEIDVVEINRKNPLRNRNEISYLPHVIWIGADLVERGITIKNLLVTYITRRGKKTNADTVLQRARWFGYREYIREYMRIFCLQEIQDDYEKILIMDDELWFDLDYLINNDNVLLSEWIKVLNLNKKNLRPTRGGVVNWNFEKIELWHTQRKLQDNKRIELDLYDELVHEASFENYGNIRHKFIEYNNIDLFQKRFNNIWDSVLYYCDISDDFWNYWKLKYPNIKIKIILMNPEADRPNYRTLLTNEQIQVFRGRSKKEKIGDYYKGDRNLNEYSNNKGLILVEVFKFNIHKKNKIKEELGSLVRKNALFYAIYFPGEGVIRYVAKQD